MRTIYIVLALGSVSIFAASSCSDDETAPPTTATQTSNVVASSTGNGTTTTTSASSAGGGSPMTCIDCLSDHSQECQDENSACSANAECDAWATCFQQCFLTMAGDDCYIDCNEMHAAAATLYNAVYACSCADCATLCGFCDLQGTGGGGTGGMNAGGAGGQ